MSPQDKTFIYRLKRSAEQVIPATAKRQIDWGVVRAFADKKKAELAENPPSAFNCVAYAIAKATAEHPKFRSTLLREEVIREHRHVNLGIAVAMQTGELVVAVRLPAPPDASVYLRTGERQAFSFPLVSVAAARRGDSVTLAAAGVANVPRALDPADPLAGLPGHPQSAWKRKVLETLVERAVAAMRSGTVGD